MKKPKTKTYKNIQKEDFELDEVDYKIIRYVLEYPSLTDTQIGELIGYKRLQVNQRRNKLAFKKAIAIYSLKPIEIIASAKPEAAIKLKKHIHSKDERVSLKACEDILGEDLKEKTADNKPIEVIIKYE